MPKKITGLYRKKNSTIWYTSVKGHGETTGTSDQTLAKAFLVERQHLALKGKYPLLVSKEGVQGQFEDFKEYYKTISKSVYAENTFQRLDYFLKDIKKFNQINFKSISKFLTTIQKDRNLTPKTRNDYRQAIHTFCEYLVKCKQISSNPVKDVPVLKDHGKRKFIFSKQEAEVLMYRSKPPLKDVLTIGFFTAMRLSEILNLEWKHIDFDRKKIYVNKTKSKYPRTIPLIEPLYSYLKSKEKSKGVVVKGSSHEGPKKAFKSLLNELKIEPDKGSLFHALRHTAITWMLESGMNVLAVQQIVGHKDIKTTMQYTHLQKGFMDKEMEKFKW